jgi:hypothetical protein
MNTIQMTTPEAFDLEYEEWLELLAELTPDEEPE